LFEQSKDKLEEPIKEISEEVDNMKSSSKAAKEATSRYIKGLNDAVDTIKDATEKKL
jgi:sugar-specific transcriptional regulator TrmB